MKKTYFLLIFVLLLLFVKTAFSAEQVVTEFPYKDPTTDPRWCDDCPPWIASYEDYLYKCEVVNQIESDYSNEVLVNWTECDSVYGFALRQLYNIPCNSLVIKDDEGNFTLIVGSFNDTYIRQVIDAYLVGEPPPPPEPLNLYPILALAFSFGFFETFSPCLLALLSFILSYTVGSTTKFKKSMSQVMVFGIGFVFAALLLGLAFGLIFYSMAEFSVVLTLLVCIFAIFLGTNLLGINVLKFFKIDLETKPLVKKLSQKHMYTYTGLLLLGFVFYFLDPCIAPIFVAMVPLLLLEYLPLILLIFSLGVIIPFVGIGILAGSISKLVRSTYRHKSKIRAVSGLILIGYSIYLIITIIL